MYTFVYKHHGFIVRVAQYPTAEYTFTRASDLEYIRSATLFIDKDGLVVELTIE